MRAGRCRGRHGARACSCEMGNLYRFSEPIILLSLARLGRAHGYQLAQEAQGLAVTHAGLDTGVIYRTLRRLEDAGRVASAWDTMGGGPARRAYVLTDSGWEHLSEWAQVLGDVADSLSELRGHCARMASTRTAGGGARAARSGRRNRGVEST